MFRGFKQSLIALSVSGALLAPSAYATNGYFGHGYSTKEKGLAGAGAAYSQDAMASATNPAGMAKVGARMDIGAAVFAPSRSYTANNDFDAPNLLPNGANPFPLSPGTFESSHRDFFIPHFAMSWQLDETSVTGLAAYANGGMNAHYKNVPYIFAPTSGTYAGGIDAGQNLAQIFINASYAKQMNDKHALGASLILAYQQFKASGLAAFGTFSNDPSNLSDRGTDSSYGFGVKLGWQGEVADGFTVGVSYQSEIAMSEFDKYKGLFAESGEFDIPSTIVTGIAWDITDSSKLVVDLQKIYYTDIPSVGNGITNLFTCTTGAEPSCLGGSNGAGFGWDDMTILKVGYQWDMNDITWRAGISHGEQPIDGDQVLFNVIAPAVVETHITFGFTMPIDASSEFTFAAMYAPTNDVTGPTQFDNTQTVKLEMDQYELAGTYSMKF